MAVIVKLANQLSSFSLHYSHHTFTVSSSSAPPPPPPPPPPSLPPPPWLSKPSWVVRTESNVWREKVKKPELPCIKCGGSGKVGCKHCLGRGRTNFVDLPMLPRGEWPKWCKTCRGSGLRYCSRCLGTGYGLPVPEDVFNCTSTDSTLEKSKEVGSCLGEEPFP